MPDNTPYHVRVGIEHMPNGNRHTSLDSLAAVYNPFRQFLERHPMASAPAAQLAEEAWDCAMEVVIEALIESCANEEIPIQVTNSGVLRLIREQKSLEQRNR